MKESARERADNMRKRDREKPMRGQQEQKRIDKRERERKSAKESAKENDESKRERAQEEIYHAFVSATTAPVIIPTTP